ncbi:MAG: hypothetical protein M3O86_00500 [Actinomycetota bacterium]|nr:hypothetical protein [Actinomycetota bacterium]
MRKLLTAGLLTAMAFAGPAAAAGDPVGEEVQPVSGSIALPNPTKASGTNFSRIGRTAGLVGPATNGMVGWFFKVDPLTLTGAFRLTTTTTADLDIIFYSDPGSLSSAPTATAEFVGAAPGGEAGFIPEGTTHAQIYAASGVNVPFAYVGYAAPVIQIGQDSLDLTVPAGTTVDWVNATADYSFVRHTPTSGTPAFDSSPKPGTGIPVGSTFSHTFAEVGTFTYETSAGTGTITVSG